MQLINTQKNSLKMANKKPTKGEQYRGIVMNEGQEWKDCKVLAFLFPNERGPERFHYKLMFESRAKYYLFDCFCNVAQIVVPKGDENERMCIQLAESCDGEKTIPNLR